MAAWEYILLGVAVLIAVNCLTRLMRAKRTRLINELQREAEDKQAAVAARKSPE